MGVGLGFRVEGRGGVYWGLSAATAQRGVSIANLHSRQRGSLK